MAVTPWLQAALAALPHITELMKSSKDLLKSNKSKRMDEPLVIDANDSQALAVQVARISKACENNSESIQILAEQMHNQLEHANQTITRLTQKLRRAQMLSTAALLMACLAAAKVFSIF
ncbi:hypothetical protein [Hydromonas duriensis]|uniref:Uncharacterized protein n=1 Tax=Hydromonas duriensis TaxID=1527608 RepID=A0A4R6Y9U3_9BURK|nr:hypothetical protein [Hydromonas duriensis]TDR32290.1 hypothetical protein DFR44_1042 [Hydromonas duriensis]